jgi:signal transduction histidine kinase
MQVEQILIHAPADAANSAIAREIDTRVAPEFNNRFVRITRVPATLVYRSGPPANRSFDPSAVSATIPTSAARTAVPVTAIVAGQHLMIRTTPVHTVSGNYLIELGVSIASIDVVLDRLLDLLALLLPVLIVCAAGGGYWLVDRALRPVDRLSQTAEQMSLQNLTLRLPVVPSGDALERLSISLNTMLGRLRDSLQTSRRFLADASHELRTPLTVIKGELQELTRESNLTKCDLHERVGSVLEEVARLEHLVSGLLVLSRLDAGETRGDWVDVDLAELALSTAEQMRLMAEDRGIEIELSALRKTLVRGDRARLKQIIVNLLDNAIRFTAPGGIVALRAVSAETGSVLEVSDTGIGIPPSAIPHVFDRFFRVDEARAREDGGAGLGLSIVKSICAAHGAEIEVESRPECGSCFRVRFPRRSISRTTVGAPSAPHSGAPPSRENLCDAPPPSDVPANMP